MQSDYSVDIIDTVVDEEVITKWGYRRTPDHLSLCKCVIETEPSEQVIISPRKQQILSTVDRTEEYLRTRRIPELIRFLLTKVIATGSPHPVSYLETLLDECMLFRAGHGQAPVLYETRHLQAVVKSFDPGNRGWLTSGQVRRAFATLGLTADKTLPDKMFVEAVLNNLQEKQENELFKLFSAGMKTPDSQLDQELSDHDSQSVNEKK